MLQQHPAQQQEQRKQERRQQEKGCLRERGAGMARTQPIQHPGLTPLHRQRRQSTLKPLLAPAT